MFHGVGAAWISHFWLCCKRRIALDVELQNTDGLEALVQQSSKEKGRDFVVHTMGCSCACASLCKLPSKHANKRKTNTCMPEKVRLARVTPAAEACALAGGPTARACTLLLACSGDGGTHNFLIQGVVNGMDCSRAVPGVSVGWSSDARVSMTGRMGHPT